MTELTLRPYGSADRAALGDVCVLTGDSGKSAKGKFFDDDLLPYIYAYPYLEYAPDLVRVADLNGRAVGYILGVADVTEFVTWWREHWTPIFAERFAGAADLSAIEERLIGLGLNPERQLGDWRGDHPGEFHIDLLPEAQGQGLGRALIDWFCRELAARGVRSIGIGVGAKNTGAIAFYRRLGFDTFRESVGEDGTPIGYLMTIPTTHEETK
ncbi:hypothetical protein BSZ39_07720 [Bowdeniella nasicola]|uniref:N-acetyltransferase domain-containing protein n=1 Tax=Bowdeniella nasicola TaxID=208480 RepID=A0A1Q5Q1L7_9ACTO|nr:GNAT family N-acetyltransferase [Bowdeniella nasicola]OKL53763.1 hypothetical protein BSZ39_07720 [Bowdeniella nasicola]